MIQLKANSPYIIEVEKYVLCNRLYVSWIPEHYGWIYDHFHIAADNTKFLIFHLNTMRLHVRHQDTNILIQCVYTLGTKTPKKNYKFNVFNDLL